MLIDRSIARVRAYRVQKGLTKQAFAQAAGMGESVLRHFDRADWNPRTDTLRKLESIIPPSFKPRKK